MTTFEQVDKNRWIKKATRGWVVYIGPSAVYFKPDQKKQAQALYDQAISEGKWASPPKPAHTGG